ncbi:MAG: aromatic ring hydroxylase [Clostridia bacterium]|nr:aromatic ring hydroxylase [Clostridia bacterium]
MLRTKEQYFEKLKGMRKNVYIGGRLLERDDPLLEGGENVIGMTFDTALDPETEDLVTATSHLNGEKISRFLHIYQNKEDLYKKQQMLRQLCHIVGGCAQRCMGTDGSNALYVTTKEIDDKMGTQYHERFKKWLDYAQKNDLVVNCAQTDVKGDRSKRPSEQVDPDLYVRVVERREDGVVVCGCKAHNTIAPYADELLVIPTRMMKEDDKDWAIAFAIPADAEGVSLVCRSTSARPRKHIDAPYNHYGMCDSMTVLDHVFVPNERIFMNGEFKFAGRLALSFANNHRFSYCGCKPAVTDVLMGATALVADYNGIAKAGHVKDELTEMAIVAELVYGAGIASATTANITSSGAYEPNFLYTNCGRYHAGMNIYHEYDVLASIAGGFPATMPPEDDYFNPATKEYMDKYIMRNPEFTAEQTHRLFRFIADYSVSAACGVHQYAGVHGGGSPVMERIGIRGFYDFESKKQIIRDLAGITENCKFHKAVMKK